MKKNQERRLHRKNAKIVKEGGTPLQLNRPLKSETTVRVLFCERQSVMIYSRDGFLVRDAVAIAGKWDT